MKLYVGWQNEDTRRWYTVGVLSFEEGEYLFSYTKGALSARETGRFRLFPRMSELNRVYQSPELFPIFSNRVLPQSRPDYKSYLQWMGLEEDDGDPLAILARSGGGKVTDNIQLYPVPEKTVEGKYRSYFFVNGVRYLHPLILELIPTLTEGQRLFPMLDCNNSSHALAVALRADDPAFLVGYCPRHAADEIGTLAKKENSSLLITVSRVNKGAPYQMMLRCKAESDWPENFETCARDECQPL